jgi:hypothetical protein
MDKSASIRAASRRSFNLLAVEQPYQVVLAYQLGLLSRYLYPHDETCVAAIYAEIDSICTGDCCAMRHRGEAIAYSKPDDPEKMAWHVSGEYTYSAPH